MAAATAMLSKLRTKTTPFIIIVFVACIIARIHCEDNDETTTTTTTTSSTTTGNKHATRLNPAERDYIISSHNAVRARQRAIGMKTLQYDQTLAKNAEDKAKECKFTNGGRGYNYWLTSNTGRRPQRSQAMRFWARESASYSHSQMACSPGRTCTDYVQMVYSDAEKVGCAMAICDRITGAIFSGAGFLVVCKYDQAIPEEDAAPYERLTPITSFEKGCTELKGKWVLNKRNNLCVVKEKGDTDDDDSDEDEQGATNDDNNDNNANDNNTPDQVAEDDADNEQPTTP